MATQVSSPDFTKQIYWDDVNEGDELPSVDFHLTIQRMVIAAGANRDFATLHHNTHVGQAAGARDMFLNNVSCVSLWERVISDWHGIRGRVTKVNFRITTFACAGDTVHVGGKVTRKFEENGQKLVELEMTSQHEHGVSTAGIAVVSLPSRG